MGHVRVGDRLSQPEVAGLKCLMQQWDRHRRKRAETGLDCSLRFARTCAAITPTALIQRFCSSTVTELHGVGQELLSEAGDHHVLHAAAELPGGAG